MDWYRDEEGNIVHDEDVQSQADLKEGQTYLGENVLQYQEEGPTRLGTEGGDWVNVFNEGQTKGEAGAKGASGRRSLRRYRSRYSMPSQSREVKPFFALRE